MGLSVLRLRVGQCLTWARWHLAPFLFGWNKEWDAQKLMISYWSFFADPQFKEEISGRLCHHCITKFCRPQNSKLKMGDQDPLHIATDGQEDSQTEFEIPHWLSFVVLHRFSCHWSPTLTPTWQALGIRMEVICTHIKLKELLESGTTDLWFDELALGYTIFLAYAPLPCLLNASFMILGES